MSDDANRVTYAPISGVRTRLCSWALRCGSRYCLGKIEYVWDAEGWAGHAGTPGALKLEEELTGVGRSPRSGRPLRRLAEGWNEKEKGRARGMILMTTMMMAGRKVRKNQATKTGPQKINTYVSRQYRDRATPPYAYA